MKIRSIEKVYLGGDFVAKAMNTKDAILSIEGYASTNDVDRSGDVIEASAWIPHMDNFMQYPVLLLNHNWDESPIGKIVEWSVDDKGLYVRAEIAPTPKGYEIKTLIEFGILKSFSVGFNIKKYTRSDDPNDPFLITEAELIELSVVNVPCNMLAMFEEAEKKELVIKHFTRPTDVRSIVDGANIIVKGNNNLSELDFVKKDELNAVVTKQQGVEAQLKELTPLIRDVKSIENALKEAKENGYGKSEMLSLIDRVEKDFKDAVDALTSKVQEIQTRRNPITGSTGFGYDLKSMITKSAQELEAVFASEPAKISQDKHLQKLNDDVLFVDALLEASSKNNEGNYHYKPKSERMKSLKIFGELSEFSKAMDSATANEGTEFVPVGYSAVLEEKVRLELKVAPLFAEISMPTKSFTLPVHITDTIATLHAEKLVVATAKDSVEQTPGTDDVTLTASKFRSRIQTSAELDEDSILAILPYISNNASRGIARAWDRGIINGQKTADVDTGYGGIGATDARKAFDGLRYHLQTTLSGDMVDISTFSEDNMRDVRANMGVYGVYPSDLAYLCSSKTYLKKFLKDLDSVLTVDKYGPNAVVLTGELAKFDGIPIILSEFVQDDLNASGIYDGTTTDRSETLLVNRNAWIRGVRRAMSVAVEKDIVNDIYNVVAFKRGDFQPLYTPTTSTGVIVNSGYNVTF
jgi:HK97 family phage prohead protease/HK97 family phage major capsid protein